MHGVCGAFSQNGADSGFKIAGRRDRFGRSKEEAKEEIRQEMVSVALAASEEVLKREVNEKDNARIVENFIKDMDK